MANSIVALTEPILVPSLYFAKRYGHPYFPLLPILKLFALCNVNGFLGGYYKLDPIEPYLWAFFCYIV